jgi:hypothetical protein
MQVRWEFIGIGVGFVFTGASVVFYVYAFSSSVDPILRGSAYWRTVILRMIRFPDPGLGTIFGMLLVFAGLCIGLMAFMKRDKMTEGADEETNGDVEREGQ